MPAQEGHMPPLVSFLAGGVAGGLEALATFPMEFAKTRVQLRTQSGGSSSKNPFMVVARVFRNEGDGVRFLSFDAIKKALADPETGAMSPIRTLLAGMCTGVVASTFAVTPTERIKTALIDDARHAKRFRSSLHAVRVIYQQHGIVGMYHGYAGTTLKQAGATAFRMGTYNILKDFEQSDDIEQNTAINFANGAIAGIVTTYATQPFDTIKTRSQSAEGATTIDAFRSILADDGVKGLWRGTTMRLGRTVFSGGILFTVYEQVAATLNPVLK
ncbi:MAG: hypothetical protein Q9210_004899 [Variospora velana]